MLKLLIVALFTSVITVSTSSVYDISIPAVSGDSIHLSAYSGKKILIVNTSLNSQYTYQLLGLQQLQQSYPDSLIVIAVPSNSFGNEPYDDSTIAFQMINLFNSSFPIAAKSEVTGTDALPLYLWLTQKAENSAMDNVVTEDFTKYLLDESGHLVGMFSSRVEPMSSDIQDAIKGIE